MTTDEPTPATGPSPAMSFGSVVESYDRGRPGYPLDAARWLTGDQPLSVLELGAGTGKLTRALVELGHDVHATDPDPAMLDHLARTVHVGRLSQTGAEEIPAADASYDIVIAGQAYHWFDKDRALPEIARVLKRGGSLSLVWNVRDERIPWVKRLGNIIGRQDVTGSGPDEALESSPYFGPVESRTFKQWQVVDRSSIRDLVLSRSNVATLPPEAREAKLAEVVAFYDDYGRGMDGMQLPYVVECFRAVVGIRPKPQTAAPTSEPEAAAEEKPDGSVEEPGEETVAITEPPTDDDSGLLLIDFR
jgi:SAM-dependent methyltransferase